MHKLTQEDLDDLNNLVQAGLIEVVRIDAAGEPSYRISSRYTVTILPGPEGAPGSGAAPRRGPMNARLGLSALPVSVGHPFTTSQWCQGRRSRAKRSLDTTGYPG